MQKSSDTTHSIQAPVSFNKSPRRGRSLPRSFTFAPLRRQNPTRSHKDSVPLHVVLVDPKRQYVTRTPAHNTRYIQDSSVVVPIADADAKSEVAWHTINGIQRWKFREEAQV